MLMTARFVITWTDDVSRYQYHHHHHPVITNLGLDNEEQLLIRLTLTLTKHLYRYITLDQAVTCAEASASPSLLNLSEASPATPASPNPRSPTTHITKCFSSVPETSVCHPKMTAILHYYCRSICKASVWYMECCQTQKNL